MNKIKLETYSVLLVSIIVSTNISAQSFSVGNTSITFYDSSRNRNIETKIFYPSHDPGENVPIASGDFPVIVFGHGFLMGWQSYQNFWEELVPEGYLVCLPTTEMGAFPDHEDFGTDLKFVSSEMQIENGDSSSLFFNSLAPKTGLMGHSMGGGASFLAAASNPTIHTLINFAAAETNPSAISEAVNISTPTLIFSGDDDCVAPPEQNQHIMYDGLSSDCKTHISIISGGHCYFANYEFHCTSGESICNPTLDITREEQQSVTFDFLKLWLQYALYEDQTAFSIFNDSLQFSKRINYSQFCNTTAIRGPIDNSEIRVFPNPVKTKLNLELTERTSGGLLVLYNIMGNKVLQTLVNTCNSQINLSKLPYGTYFIVYLKGSWKYSTLIMKTQNN